MTMMTTFMTKKTRTRRTTRTTTTTQTTTQQEGEVDHDNNNNDDDDDSMLVTRTTKKQPYKQHYTMTPKTRGAGWQVATMLMTRMTIDDSNDSMPVKRPTMYTTQQRNELTIQ